MTKPAGFDGSYRDPYGKVDLGSDDTKSTPDAVRIRFNPQENPGTGSSRKGGGIQLTDDDAPESCCTQKVGDCFRSFFSSKNTKTE